MTGPVEYNKMMDRQTPPVTPPPTQVTSPMLPVSPPPSPVTPSDRLRALAEKRDGKRAEYGDHYLQGGASLLALFPKGIALQTERDFGRFKMIVYMLDKIHRYAVNLKLPGGHGDSLDDLAIYAMLARDLDARDDL
jgi:hypothetical protein